MERPSLFFFYLPGKNAQTSRPLQSKHICRSSFKVSPLFLLFTCLILLSVSFTSPRHSLRLATKLISPLLSLKAPPISSCPYSSPSFFFIEGPQSCFTSPSSVIPPPTLQLFTQSWRLESPPLDLAAPPPTSSLFPLSSPVSLRALLQRLCLVCQPVKLLRYSTSC